MAEFKVGDTVYLKCEIIDTNKTDGDRYEDLYLVDIIELDSYWLNSREFLSCIKKTNLPHKEENDAN